MRHSRLPLAAAVSLALLAAVAQQGHAVETWAVRSGQVIFNFNEPLMTDLGLAIVSVNETAPDPDPLTYWMEAPYWTFEVTSASSLTFELNHGRLDPYSYNHGGVIAASGGFAIEDVASGRRRTLEDFEIEFVTGSEPDPDYFFIRNAVPGEPFTFDLTDAMAKFVPGDDRLVAACMSVRISADLAGALGRSDLAGWTVGTMDVQAGSEYVSGVSEGQPYIPTFGAGVDVKLGILSSVQEVGHVGTFPNGTSGVSMSTTSCNVGTADVPWLAPMQENHPQIYMALYREMDGHFEQIGISDAKHGFFALSSSQCTPCQHPSDGSFLGVGCSDTYGVGNNADRTWLGPRREVNPYTGEWECTGSHFSGGQPDCVRRHSSGGHDAVDHRLRVKDADLNNPGATYWYEGYYVVRDDESRHNNWAYRGCTMTWTGSAWSFNSSGSQIEGPAVEGWGDSYSYTSIGANDGKVLLAVDVTDLGGGMWRYDYAMLNQDSDRMIRSFRVPKGLADAVITNLEYHDWDSDATNDWGVTVTDTEIEWSTDTFAVDPNANALSLALMFNFRFDCNVAPTNFKATLDIFKPGSPATVFAATQTPPAVRTSVEGQPVAAAVRLAQNAPNPVTRTTQIEFSLPVEGAASLEVFDASGRRVRTLASGTRSAGAGQVVWDRTDDGGRVVSPGVYYYRLTTPQGVQARSLIVAQ